jgi:hypothetical protein
MSLEYFVIGFLCFLILAQNVFWAKVCFNLTNRIMSRDYSELRQAEAPQRIVPLKPAEDEHDPIAERQAQELNAMFGMV